MFYPKMVYPKTFPFIPVELALAAFASVSGDYFMTLPKK